jgi:hypothetical protein
MTGHRLKVCLLTMMLVHTAGSSGYPLDGYDTTLIRRLQIANPDTLPAGAKLPAAAVIPSGQGVESLPASDQALADRIRSMLGDEAALYSVALLDVSDPDNPRFAVHNPEIIANIGSVGKLLVLLTLFDQLARLYPEDIEHRQRILSNTIVNADDWVIPNHHTVPVFDTGAGRILNRRLLEGDTGNLWEYLDWMLSASSNAAASMLVQQVILLQQFGQAYPVDTDTARAFLHSSNAGQLGRLWLAAMERAVLHAGLDPARLRQGGPFTATASRRVAGTTSVGNTTDLVRLLNLIETSRFVDSWSSTEAKRLLYSTQRRIRYASHPALNDSAVYFKSGSFYSCEPEPDFVCRQYMGNRINRLASIASIETPAGAPRLRYHVAVMSNVLRVNSAVAHQTLALRIHRLVEEINTHRSGQLPDTVKQSMNIE